MLDALAKARKLRAINNFIVYEVSLLSTKLTGRIQAFIQRKFAKIKVIDV